MRMKSRQILCLALLLLPLPGCASFGSKKDVAAGSSPPNATRIIYRTKSDRINVATGGAWAGNPMAGAAGATTLLPNVSTSHLHLVYPHPSGRMDIAQASLLVTPGEGGVDGEPSTLQYGAYQKRVLDIPAWQVESIVNTLDQERFFERSKVLDAEANLGVRHGKRGNQKKFRAVNGLDALIVRVSREGRPGGHLPAAPVAHSWPVPHPHTVPHPQAAWPAAPASDGQPPAANQLAWRPAPAASHGVPATNPYAPPAQAAPWQPPPTHVPPSNTRWQVAPATSHPAPVYPPRPAGYPHQATAHPSSAAPGAIAGQPPAMGQPWRPVGHGNVPAYR